MFQGLGGGSRILVGSVALLCFQALPLPGDAQTRGFSEQRTELITHPEPVERHQSPLRDYSHQESQQRVLQWLRDADYAAMEDYFAPCFDNPPVLGRLELDCHQRLEVSAVYDLEIQSALQFWTIEHPDSYLAAVLMAHHLWEAAWAHRGFGFSNTISSERMDSYSSYLEGASIYAESARELAPEQPYAVAILVNLYGSQNHLNDQARALYDSYLDANPYSYIVRQEHLTRLQPRWGGSDAELQELVDSAAPYLDGNSQLQLLFRWPAVSIANDFRTGYGPRAQDSRRALEMYRIVLEDFPDASNARLNFISLRSQTDDFHLEALRDMPPFLRDHLLTHNTHNRLDLAMGSMSAHLPRVHLHERALALHPDSPALHAKLGNTYRLLEWNDLAVEAYETARQRAPFDILVEREYRRAQRALGVEVPEWSEDIDYLFDYLVHVFPAEQYLPSFVEGAAQQIADLGGTATLDEIRAALEDQISHADIRRDMESFWRRQALDLDALDVITTFYAEMRSCACHYTEAHRERLRERAVSEHEPLLQAALDQAWEYYVRRVNAWLNAL